MCQEKSYHHQNLLGELIRAGISIMNSEGESNLTIRKIATAYHVSHAAPYRHFEDKEALLDSMQKYIEDEFTTALQNSLNDYATPETNMASFGKAYVTFFSENPIIISFLYVIKLWIFIYKVWESYMGIIHPLNYFVSWQKVI